MKPKYFETLNHAFIGHFARRFADLINEQGAALLSQLDLETPPKSVSSILFLHSCQSTTAAQLADALDVTHQMATQRINTLVDLALIERRKNPEDKRSHAITLSQRGKMEAKVLLAFTKHVSQVFEDLNQELQCDLKASLLKAEQSLKHRPLAERMRNKIDSLKKLT